MSFFYDSSGVWGDITSMGLGATAAFVGVYAFSSGMAVESLGGDSSATALESAESVSATPDGATVGAVALGSAALCGFSSSSTEDGPDAIIEVFFRNQVPYSITEKKAQKIYATLHGNRECTPSYPVLIAESKEAMETIQNVFGSCNVSNIVDKLEIFEGLLSSISN